jgi:hypothetical protein
MCYIVGIYGLVILTFVDNPTIFKLPAVGRLFIPTYNYIMHGPSYTPITVPSLEIKPHMLPYTSPYSKLVFQAPHDMNSVQWVGPNMCVLNSDRIVFSTVWESVGTSVLPYIPDLDVAIGGTIQFRLDTFGTILVTETPSGLYIHSPYGSIHYPITNLPAIGKQVSYNIPLVASEWIGKFSDILRNYDRMELRFSPHARVRIQGITVQAAM